MTSRMCNKLANYDLNKSLDEINWFVLSSALCKSLLCYYRVTHGLTLFQPCYTRFKIPHIEYISFCRLMFTTISAKKLSYSLLNALDIFSRNLIFLIDK